MLDMLRNLGGAALASSSESVLEIFTSEIAIIIYVFVILAIIAVLVVAVICSQRNNTDDTEIEFLDEVQNSPKYTKNTEASENEERFCMLSAIDRKQNG